MKREDMIDIIARTLDILDSISFRDDNRVRLYEE